MTAVLSTTGRSHEHDLWRMANGDRCRTVSAAPHPRTPWPLWSESGRQTGVSDLSGGELPTAEASAAEASRSPLARTRNVANAVARRAPAPKSKRSCEPCRRNARAPILSPRLLESHGSSERSGVAATRDARVAGVVS